MDQVIYEYPLANIARVDIQTEGEAVERFSLTDVYNEAETLAYLSEGEEQYLRIKNTIKAQNNTEDIVMGYNTKLLAVTLVPELYALIDGGTWDPDKKEYNGPKMGIPVNRKLFTTFIYTEIKDADGGTTGYVEFTYKHCKGKPVNFQLKDGEFYVPEMNIISRPKIKEAPISWKIIEELPDENKVTPIEPEETGK